MIKLIKPENLGFGFRFDHTDRKIHVVSTHIHQFIMKDTSMDYASKVEKTTPWGDFADINDGLVLPLNNEFSVLVDGRLTLSGSISMIKVSGTVTRNNIAFWWEFKRGNGAWTKFGGKYQSNYLRNTSSHYAVSQNFSPFTKEFLVGDKIRMRHKQLSGYGGVQRIDPNVDSYIRFQAD
jgi:hypothetical protein